MINVNAAACPQNHPCPAVVRCPAGALTQDDIYSAPRIDRELCTECGVCVTACRVFSQAADPLGVC